MTISSWLNFGCPAPPERGFARAKIFGSALIQQAVFASPLSTFFIIDGLKDSIRVSSAAVNRDITKIFRISDNASIFTAELYAIVLAFGLILRSSRTKFVILWQSDSLSALQAVSNFSIGNANTREYSRLASCGKLITMCWIPSHVGITGNEKADSAAKRGLN